MLGYLLTTCNYMYLGLKDFNLKTKVKQQQQQLFNKKSVPNTHITTCSTNDTSILSPLTYSNDNHDLFQYVFIFFFCCGQVKSVVFLLPYTISTYRSCGVNFFVTIWNINIQDQVISPPPFFCSLLVSWP